MTKRLLLLVMMSVATLTVAEDKSQSVSSGEVIHVATALDHLTVLEFGEPVAMAAAGSTGFQIERHDDKVLIKPLKGGASTDLLVWTASGRRFVYELEPAGDLQKMNFAVDRPMPKPAPVANTQEQMSEIADMMLMLAFLNAERIDSSHIKDEKDSITVRVDHVFRSSTTFYIHYSVHNSGKQKYRLPDPAVYQLPAAKPETSLFSLRRTQLDRSDVRKLGSVKPVRLQIASAGTQKQEVPPGEEAEGIVAIRRQFSGPTAFELIFPDQGERHVSAIFVH